MMSGHKMQPDVWYWLSDVVHNSFLKSTTEKKKKLFIVSVLKNVPVFCFLFICIIDHLIVEAAIVSKLLSLK